MMAKNLMHYLNSCSHIVVPGLPIHFGWSICRSVAHIKLKYIGSWKCSRDYYEKWNIPSKQCGVLLKCGIFVFIVCVVCWLWHSLLCAQLPNVTAMAFLFHELRAQVIVDLVRKTWNIYLYYEFRKCYVCVWICCGAIPWLLYLKCSKHWIYHIRSPFQMLSQCKHEYTLLLWWWMTRLP